MLQSHSAMSVGSSQRGQPASQPASGPGATFSRVTGHPPRQLRCGDVFEHCRVKSSLKKRVVVLHLGEQEWNCEVVGSHGEDTSKQQQQQDEAAAARLQHVLCRQTQSRLCEGIIS